MPPCRRGPLAAEHGPRPNRTLCSDHHGRRSDAGPGLSPNRALRQRRDVPARLLRSAHQRRHGLGASSIETHNRPAAPRAAQAAHKTEDLVRFHLDEINYWAVLTAGLLTFFIGGLWYTALFGQQWV